MRTILLDLLIFLALFAAAEIFLRVFAPETKRLIFSEKITGGHEVSYNEYGLRDEAFPIKKPKGERRILALGNSTTFGSGVAVDETWPKVLQQKLGPSWFVINAGGQGSTLSEMIDFVENQGLVFKPEIIILGFSPSMIAPPKTSESGTLRHLLLPLHKALHASYAYSAFDFYVRKNLYRLGILRDSPRALYAYEEEAKEAYEGLARDLDRVSALAHQHNIRLLILGIPSSFEFGNSFENNPRRFPLDQIRIQPLDQIARLAKEQGIPFTDLREGLKSGPHAYIPGDYTHLNAAGHEITAKEILQRIPLLSSRTPKAEGSSY